MSRDDVEINRFVAELVDIAERVIFLELALDFAEEGSRFQILLEKRVASREEKPRVARFCLGVFLHVLFQAFDVLRRDDFAARQYVNGERTHGERIVVCLGIFGDRAHSGEAGVHETVRNVIALASRVDQEQRAVVREVEIAFRIRSPQADRSVLAEARLEDRDRAVDGLPGLRGVDAEVLHERRVEEGPGGARYLFGAAIRIFFEIEEEPLRDSRRHVRDGNVARSEVFVYGTVCRDFRGTIFYGARCERYAVGYGGAHAERG